MKKTIFWIFLALVSGSLLGKFTFDTYENIEVRNVININDKVYMLKYGTYENVEQMIEEIIDIDRYIYIEEENKVTAYIGISTTKENINKIKSIYDKKGIITSIEKLTISNDEFIQNLNEYEKLLSATEDESSLLIIQKQILSCYEELVANNE